MRRTISPSSLGSANGILRDALGRLNGIDDLETLRGVEGAAARAWFDLFRRCNRSELRFEGREQRPAADPINALLSFGYMMVLNELDGLLQGAGLDSCVGFYHGAHGNRPALACDWVEEFRHPIVDRLVLGLLNRGSITTEHFHDAGERGVRLTPDGLRVFLTAYERLLLGDGRMPGGYRAVFLRQLGRLLDAISGRAPYASYREAADAPDDVPLPADRSTVDATISALAAGPPGTDAVTVMDEPSCSTLSATTSPPIQSAIA